MQKSMTVLAIAAMLFAGFEASARDEGPAKIDIQKRCGVRAKSTAAMLGDSAMTTVAFDSCVKSEQEARAALVAAWKDIPASYKAFCIRPNVYSPSYTEWIACIELNIDLKRLRARSQQ